MATEQGIINSGQDFFNSLRLRHIYGDLNTIEAKINKRSFLRLTNPDPDIVAAEAERIIQAGPLRGISFIEANKQGYFVYEGAPVPLAWWAPHRFERQFLTRLAHSLTGEFPFILDVACGTGLLAKLLAAETDAKVVGLDPGEIFNEMSGIDRLPDTPGNILLRKKDVWKAVNTYGPKYPYQLNRERRELLKRLKREPEKVSIFLSPEYPYSSSAKEGFNRPNEGVEELSDEVKRIQEIAPLYKAPSPIDLVICSFMPVGADLTVPIRDGIYPKGIVYVRQMRGGTGTGDYFLYEYLNPESSKRLRYSQISFNPGEHYQVVARWPTPSQNNWHASETNKLQSPMTAEVVVQLRKDVVLAKTDRITCPSYPWDQDIEDFLGQVLRKELFFAGIEQATNSLFA